MDNSLSLLEDCLKTLKSKGADAADGLIFDTTDINVRQRLGKPETIERSESRDIGLRAFIKTPEGFKQALVSSSDTSPETLEELAERVVSMAKAAPVDPYCGLADESLLVHKSDNSLDLYDANDPTTKQLQDIASRAEEAALAVEGITNSDGADASYSSYNVALVNSNGFAQEYKNSSHSLSTSVIAGEGDDMQTDYDYSVAVHGDDLKSPEKIGRDAGERSAKKLHPQKMSTSQVPVIFEPRVARSLLGSLSGAINGSSIARGTSFLKDEMDKQIFAQGVNIIDDPFIVRGLASRPFDAEGVAGEKRCIIEDGKLTTWLLDTRSAHQLGLATTGHASRGISSVPHPSSTNFYLEAGDATPEELIADIKDGFYVTEAFGMGVNGITGDYSQGASGFWIENGKISYPVSELTIAGNLRNMYKNLTPASDLEFLYGTNSPTVRIEGMTTAGA